jgi:hypothetical protein
MRDAMSLAAWGPFASTLRCRRSRSLSTTPDITTSDREPSACPLLRPISNNGHSRRSSRVLTSVDLANMTRCAAAEGPHNRCMSLHRNCSLGASPGSCQIAVWRSTARERRGANRRPSDGRIKAQGAPRLVERYFKSLVHVTDLAAPCKNPGSPFRSRSHRNVPTKTDPGSTLPRLRT